MPSAQYTDEYVARMRMDNEQFEKGAERTMGTIERLKKSLKFNTSDSEIGGLNTSLLEKSIDKIEGKFNALQVAGRRMVENLTDGFVNLAKQAITGADSITPGFQKYEDQVAAIQKLMIATGKSMEDVQAISDKILKFTDETSYEYNSMLSTMSAFTSSGVDMETAANTIIGMAVAAGQAGVNAKDATHAFMGFQKAIASGYMGSAQWDWIRTAGMNSAELKTQLLEAAVATGDLQKGADGVYYAIKQTSKGAQQIAVSVENFEQSFANKWLSGEAIEMAMGKYSKAFNQIMEIHEKTGAEIFEIIADDSPYLEYIDAYGLAAFKAGQETKTWSDALEALKSAMSSGWMKSFELIIGNYKQASGFFSDLIEPLYQIFVNPGNKRNKFLEAAFGGGGAITKTVANWDKLKTKLEGAGKSMKDFEEAYAKYVLDTKDASLLSLVDDYGSLEAAIRAGAISGEQLNGILNNIAGVTTEASDAMVEGAVDATAALQQYKEVAMAVLRGDYGAGQERIDAIEAMGLDYDTVQWLAGNLGNGKGFDAVTLEWFRTTAPNAYQRFIDAVGAGNPVINSATGEIISLGDVTDELSDKIDQMTGRELWQGSVLNVVTALADAFDAVGEAFDKVFGSAEVRGKGFRGILERIYRLTLKLTGETEDGLQSNGGFLDSVRSSAESIFNVLKAIGSPLKRLFKLTKSIRSVVLSLIDKFLGIFTGNKNINSKFGTLSSIIEKLGIILTSIIDGVGKLFKTSGDGIDGIVDKIKKFSLKEFFKPITDFFQGDSPIAKMLHSLAEPFTKLFGEGSIFEKLQSFFSGFSESGDEMSKSMDNLSASFGGIGDGIGKVLNFANLLTDGLEGKESFKEKVKQLWNNFKSVVAEEYKKINWETVLDAAKFGLLATMVVRINSFFKNLNKVIKAPKTSIQSLVDTIKGFTGAITGPFTALSKAITEGEKANRYLKIAAAIGVLAMSIYLLTTVDEQKFMNVAMTLGILMMIMARMAKNMDGFQLFSNNNKTISKNNPVQNTIKAFENLKSAFSADFTNAKLNVNVFSNVAQILVGIAAAVVAIVHAFNQIRDIKDPNEVKTALFIIGGILAYLAIVIPVMEKLSEEAKYAGKVGVLMVALGATILMITNAFVKIGSAQGLDWTAIAKMFGMMVVVMIGIAAILKISTGFVNQGESLFSSGGAILAIAGVMLALGILVRSLVKSLAKATEIENLTKGVVIIAALLIALVAVFAIMSFLAEDTTGADGMLKIAGSMVILAVALLVLVPAIALLSALPAAGLLAAAGALGIMILAIAGAMAIMKSVEPKTMLAVAAAFVLVAIGVGLMSAAILLFNGVMLAAISTIPWADMIKQFNDFRLAMDVIIPTLVKFSLIALVVGAALLLMGLGAVGIGAGFILGALGLLAASAALFVFGKALTAVGEGLPAFAEGLVKLYDVVDQNGWKVIVTLGLLVGLFALFSSAIKGVDTENLSEKMDGFGETFGAAIEKVIDIMKVMSPQFLKALAAFLGLALTFIIALLPLAITKLVKLIVTFIYSLTDAIYANSDVLISAFESLFGTILAIAMKTLFTFVGDVVGFFGEFIAEVFRMFGWDRAANGIEKYFNGKATNAAIEQLKEATDRALNDTFLSHRKDGEVEIEIKATTDATSIDDIFDDPEFQAAISDYETSMDGIGEDVGEKLGSSTVESTKEELSGNGESSGLPGIIGEVLPGGYEDLIPSDFGSTAESTIGSGDMNFGMGGTETEGGNFGQQAMNYLTSNLTSPEILGSVKDSGGTIISNFTSSLGSSLTDSLNIENVMGGLRNMFGGTIQSEETTTMFTDGGFNLGQTTALSTADGLESEESTAALDSAVRYDNDITAEGWNQQTDINAPLMANYMVSGLETSMNTDPVISERLREIGAEIYRKVERGMRRAAGIASPSKAMAQNGVYLMQGLMNGITDGSEQVYGTADVVTGSLLNSFQNAMAQMLSMINADMNLQPTITPVMDMQNVDASIADMNSQLSGYYGMTAETAGRIHVANPRAQRDNSSVLANGINTANQGFGGIVVNVYPSAGMDEKALADKVITRINELDYRRSVAKG